MWNSPAEVTHVANSNVGAGSQVCYMLQFLSTIPLSLPTVTSSVHSSPQPQLVQKTSLLMLLIGHQAKSERTFSLIYSLVCLISYNLQNIYKGVSPSISGSFYWAQIFSIDTHLSCAQSKSAFIIRESFVKIQRKARNSSKLQHHSPGEQAPACVGDKSPFLITV